MSRRSRIAIGAAIALLLLGLAIAIGISVRGAGDDEAVIAGRVTDENGNPLANVLVNAFVEPQNSEGESFLPWRRGSTIVLSEEFARQVVQTDSGGHYRFSLRGSGLAVLLFDDGVRATGDTNAGFKSRTTQTVDWRLVPGLTVKGSVRDSSGRGVRARVATRDADHWTNKEVALAGEFTMTRVAPGAHEIVACGDAGRDRVLVHGTAGATVTATLVLRPDIAECPP